MQTQAARKETIAVGVVEHHAGTRPRRSERTGIDFGKDLNVAPGVADDGRFARGAARGVNPDDLILWNRKLAKRIGVAQVLFAGNRKPRQVLHRPDLPRMHAGLVKRTSIEGNPFIHVTDQVLKPFVLQHPEPVSG